MREEHDFEDLRHVAQRGRRPKSLATLMSGLRLDLESAKLRLAHNVGTFASGPAKMDDLLTATRTAVRVAVVTKRLAPLAGGSSRQAPLGRDVITRSVEEIISMITNIGVILDDYAGPDGRPDLSPKERVSEFADLAGPAITVASLAQHLGYGKDVKAFEQRVQDGERQPEQDLNGVRDVEVRHLPR